MGNTQHREIEANFINIDVSALKAKLIELGATDHGEVLLKERIFYPERRVRTGHNRFVRLRQYPDKTLIAYKDRQQLTVDGTEEIEFEVGDLELATLFIERMGMFPVRIIEKRRHSLTCGDVLYDFDVWPFGKPILQIEGPSAEAVQQASEQLGLAWKDALFDSPVTIMTKHFGVDFEGHKVVTFEKLEKYDE